MQIRSKRSRILNRVRIERTNLMGVAPSVGSTAIRHIRSIHILFNLLIGLGSILYGLELNAANSQAALPAHIYW
jgi:hypothetical protein